MRTDPFGDLQPGSKAAVVDCLRPEESSYESRNLPSFNSRTLLLAVRDVRLRSFVGVMGHLQGVGMSGMGVMSGRLMMPRGVVPGSDLGPAFC